MAIDAKKGLMIIGGVAVAIVGAIGAGLYFSFRRPSINGIDEPTPSSWTKCLPKKGELKTKKVHHIDKKIFYPAGCGCANSGQRCLKK